MPDNENEINTCILGFDACGNPGFLHKEKPDGGD
jgi:hypothetical protein